MVVLGAGGHAREIAWMLASSPSSAKRTPDAFAVSERGAGVHIDGIEVLLLEDLLRRFPEADFVAAIGDPSSRRRVSEEVERHGWTPVAVVHESAHVHPAAEIQAGAVVFAGAIVSAGVSIGSHAHVNFSATISHDCQIASYALLSPGCHIGGNVVVEAQAIVGIGATVLHGLPQKKLSIGAGAVVAAGATVIEDVPARVLVAGTPAKRIKSVNAQVVGLPDS